MLNSDELLFVVDENNNPLESKPRKEVHEKGHWHRTAHIWIINSAKQILCQKRSLLKDSNPGKWEPYFGGHLQQAEEYIDNAVNELQEEISIESPKNKLNLFETYKCEHAKEFQGIYYLTWDGHIGDLKLEKDEIDKVDWIPIEKLNEILSKRDSNWTISGYEKRLLEYLKR